MKCLATSIGAFALLALPVQAMEPAVQGHVAGHAAGAGQGAMGLEIPQPDKADFKTVPGVPSCTTIAGLRGDPSKEAATLMVRMTSGCVVPFHWHHATEEVVMLQGTAVTQMMGGKPYELKPGSYSQLPKEHVHRMRCASKEDCYNFVVADRAFDIFFVDAAGKAISTEQALAAAEKDKSW
jgi:quercetin dioxygenase-like cupin family protein